MRDGERVILVNNGAWCEGKQSISALSLIKITVYKRLFDDIALSSPGKKSISFSEFVEDLTGPLKILATPSRTPPPPQPPHT